VDLEHPVEPLAFGADDPSVTIVILDVEDGQDVGREARLVRVVDGKLGGDRDAPFQVGEVAAQRRDRARLRLEVTISSGGDISASVTSPGSAARTSSRSAADMASHSCWVGAIGKPASDSRGEYI
jgi:hypothetical protein